MGVGRGFDFLFLSPFFFSLLFDLLHIFILLCFHPNGNTLHHRLSPRPIAVARCIEKTIRTMKEYTLRFLLLILSFVFFFSFGARIPPFARACGFRSFCCLVVLRMGYDRGNFSGMRRKYREGKTLRGGLLFWWFFFFFFFFFKSCSLGLEGSEGKLAVYKQNHHVRKRNGGISNIEGQE